MEEKYNKNTIYIHNLSSFDSIYLLKNIFSKYKCKTHFKEGKCIYINISNVNNREKKGESLKIDINDSLLLLPLSLEKLIEGFSIETNKLPFPYKFITEDKVKSNYIGEIPSYSYYYKHFNLENYNKYIELANKFKNKQ